MHNTLKITKQTLLKGENGYKVFSVRVKESTIDALDRIVKETHRPRNEIINLILDFGIANLEVTDEQQ